MDTSSLSTKKIKIVAIRYDFWAQNVPKMLLCNPVGGAHSAPPGPLAGFGGASQQGREGEEGGKGKVEEWREEGGRRKGRKGGEGGKGEVKEREEGKEEGKKEGIEGKGKGRWGAGIVVLGD